MKNYLDNRKGKEAKPVVAICYDFDKTLSPDNMQAQGYIQSVGYDVTDDFWTKSNGLAIENEMDQNLAYMYLMITEADGQLVVNKKNLQEYGAKVQLFPGVNEWFERINAYGEEKGVIVEHYIISSGLKEMIEGTALAKKGVFERIYASSFFYNEKGAAKWPAQVVNYTNKTQFLFRIEKGTLDINDPGVNDSFDDDEIRVPFRNMIYIGDSDTDVPCMKLVNAYGGHSVAVYNPATKDKTLAYKMMREKRIRYYAAADYSEGKDLDLLVKNIIDRTVYNENLENIYYAQLSEQRKNDASQSEEERVKGELTIALENSRSYATTHIVISKMHEISSWTKTEKEELFRIALENSQVSGILCDVDVRTFFEGLIKKLKAQSENAKKIKEIITRKDSI
ncbi:MAG: haloacid dehalogenase-like hydrolase [Clostridiales bacterium]|nr:haloacid dehalogenase-like hydrolase [Clostridiales bacterium]